MAIHCNIFRLKALAQGTLPGEHGAIKMVASRNDIIRQKAFIWDASAEISPRASFGRNDVIFLLRRNDVI